MNNKISLDTVLKNSSDYILYISSFKYSDCDTHVLGCITLLVFSKQSGSYYYIDVTGDDIIKLLNLNNRGSIEIVPMAMTDWLSDELGLNKIPTIDSILENLSDYDINIVYIDIHAVTNYNSIHKVLNKKPLILGYKAYGKFEVTDKKSGYTFGIIAHNEDAIRLREAVNNQNKVDIAVNKVVDIVLKNKLIQWLRDISIITNYEYTKGNYSASEYNNISLVFKLDADKDSDELRYLIKDALIRDLTLHEQVYEVNCNNSLNKNTEHVMNINIVI